MYPKVAIIILNWNGWKDTIECLESLYRVTYPNYDVIVVDNYSTDNSIEKIENWANNNSIYIVKYNESQAKKGGDPKKEKYLSKLLSNKKIRLIINNENYGFAIGNNIGIYFALNAINPDYILLLNNDTYVDERFLTELIKVAESDEKIGILGPKMYYAEPPDVFWSAGGKLNMYLEHWQRGTNENDIGQFEKIEDVDFIAGACMLIKRDVIEKIGLLPTEYFLGWEDIDYCISAKKNGFKCVYVPTARIWHKVSASYRRGKMNYAQVKLGIRNRILFRYKYLSLFEFILFISLFIFIVTPLYLTYYMLYYRDLKRVKSFFEGLAESFSRILKVSKSSSSSAQE